MGTGHGLHLPDSVVAVIAFGRRQLHCASGERFRSATGRSYLIRAMANAGRCRNPCAGGTQSRLAIPEGISCIESGNELRSGSGSASCGCWLATVYVGSSDELARRGCCCCGSFRNSSSSAMPASGVWCSRAVGCRQPVGWRRKRPRAESCSRVAKVAPPSTVCVRAGTRTLQRMRPWRRPMPPTASACFWAVF